MMQGATNEKRKRGRPKGSANFKVSNDKTAAGYNLKEILKDTDYQVKKYRTAWHGKFNTIKLP